MRIGLTWFDFKPLIADTSIYENYVSAILAYLRPPFCLNWMESFLATSIKAESLKNTQDQGAVALNSAMP